MNYLTWNQIHPYLDTFIDIGTLFLFVLVVWITKRLLEMGRELKKIKKDIEKIDSTFVSYLSMLDEENAHLKKKLRKSAPKQKHLDKSQ